MVMIPAPKVLRCLYSSQLTKKKKTWCDGQAKLDEKTGTLYLHKWSDAIHATVGGPIDMICPPRQLLDAFLARKVLELEMENHIVSVDGVNDEEEQQPGEQMETLQQRSHHPWKRPRVFKPPERISRTCGPPATTMYHVDDPVPPFYHFHGREAEAVHNMHHESTIAPPCLRSANNGEDETGVNRKENTTNNGFLSQSDVTERMANHQSSHHIMKQQAKPLSSSTTQLGYQPSLRLRDYLDHNENDDQMLIGGARQMMHNQEQFRTTPKKTFTQGVLPQATNGNDESLVTGHYPSLQGNTSTIHQCIVNTDAILRKDELAGHRSSPFVRSASDILSLLEGDGAGKIGNGGEKEDRIEKDDKRQGHGLDREIGCGDSGSVTATNVLPVKTHKEEKCKGDWDSLHEVDGVITTTNTSIVNSEKNGWPQFSHSRAREEEPVKRSEKGIIPHSVPATAGSSKNQQQYECGSLLQVDLSDFSSSSQDQ